MSASRRSTTAAGSLVALLSILGAVGILVELVLAYAAPASAPARLLPFFDRLQVPTHGPLAASLAISAACLTLVGVLLLRRSRFAPMAFLLLGWGGLTFTLAAVWPGKRLRFMMDLAVTNAKRQGAAPDVTIWDLVPNAVYAGVVAFILIWVALLIVGSVHVVRQRAEYVR